MLNNLFLFPLFLEKVENNFRKIYQKPLEYFLMTYNSQ